MHVKTMEGLIGARVNMNLTREPMRVFREASRKDDFATMERAMGYVNEYEDRAFEYKKTADDGMEKEAEENREKEKLAREEAIKKRREERKAQEEKLAAERQENKAEVTGKKDTAPKTEGTEGENSGAGIDGADTVTGDGTVMDATGASGAARKGSDILSDKPVFYSSSGMESKPVETDTSTVDVSV